jgi:glyoxylase-like metal-dependent hydrolase (beta-lactamase superfamily II)
MTKPLPSRLLVEMLCLLAIGGRAGAQTAPEVTLTRIDCGMDAEPRDVARFSDTYGYPNLKLTFTFSCYLIKHGGDSMVWDTGFAPGSNPTAPKVSLADRLKEVGVAADQVKFVGISHFHGDHTGQLAPFSNATLLIGKGDWDGVTATPPMAGANAAGFKTWIDEKRKVEPLLADKDVFGDGSVVVLRTPGHTPGHSSLLVMLKGMGPVLLSGDLMHFRENYEFNRVPSFNVDRAATLASLLRAKELAKNLKATVVIQHDAREIGTLPAFPAAAK